MCSRSHVLPPSVVPKRTDELIPLCHSLPLEHVQVQFSWPEKGCLLIEVEAAATARARVWKGSAGRASVASLTVYDMCKALDKSIVIDRYSSSVKPGASQVITGEGRRIKMERLAVSPTSNEKNLLDSACR